MARVQDLWFAEVRVPGDPVRKVRKKTARHPDNGGSKDAKRWLACWIDPAGREKTKAFKVQENAKRYARDMESAAERGEYIDPDAGKVLFGPLAAKWLRLREVGGSSQDRYERCNRLHVEPTFGHRQVKSPRPSEILEWLRDLAKTHGEATQALAYIIVCGVFDLAVADGLRKDNPARSPIVPRPRHEGHEREAWPVDQVWRVIDAHPTEYRAIPIVSAGCGLREGEAFALSPDDFDFAAGKVRIRRQLQRIGSLWTFKAPKGGKERVAPLSAGVARAVVAHIDASPPRAYTLPWRRENGDLVGEHTCKLLFRWQGDDPRSHDRHIRSSSYNDSVWKPALAAAGIIGEPEKGPRGGVQRHAAAPDDGTHALRHYYVTTLLDAGVSLAGVMEFVGHSKKGAPVTLGIYGHVTDDTFEAARNAVDRSLFQLRAVQDQGAAGTETEQASSH